MVRLQPRTAAEADLISQRELVFDTDNNLIKFNDGTTINNLIYSANDKVGINTTAPDLALEINQATGQCLRLTYNDADGSATLRTDFTVTASGALLIESSGNYIHTGAFDNFNVTTHNGTTTGLRLSNVLVTATAAELNILDGVITTASELNVLSGITATTAELNILDGVTATATELNTLDGITATVSELNILDGVTATAAELNILDGVTATAAELNYLAGITAGTATADKALVLDSSSDITGINNLDTTFLGVGITNPGTAATIELQTDSALSDRFLRVRRGDTGITDNVQFLLSATRFDIITSGVNTRISNSFNILSHDGATLGLQLGNVLVTATADELNILDGVTATTAELNILDGVTATASELNILDGVTATAAELNILDGVTATATELNYLDITTAGTAEASKALVTDGSNDISGLNSLTVTTLNTTNFTISGVISNLATGSILVRSFSGPNMTGRMILKESQTSIDLTDYNPAGSTDNWSVEFIGYVQPEFTETYTFYVTSTDKVRIFVDQVNIYNDWQETNRTDQATSTIDLTGGNWYPLYIQWSDIASSASFTLKWSSASQATQIVPSARLAFDDKDPNTKQDIVIEDSITLYNSTTTAENSAVISVDTSGDIEIDNASSLDIASHDGSTAGLYLGGTLITTSAAELNILDGVTATATELNYLDITAAGTAEASKALVLDGSSDISGINSLSATSLTGTLQTAAQPNITSIGTLAALSLSDTSGNLLTLNTTDATGRSTILFETNGSDWELGARGSGDDQANAFYIYDVTNTEFRLAVTPTGLFGINTTAPDKQIEINSTTGDCMRLTYNDSDGSATNYSDFTVSSSGDLTIEASGDDINIESTTNLDITGHDGSSVGLKLGGTLITATAAELNILDGVTATASELNYLDITTAGTAEASKALVTDGSNNITGINSISSSEVKAVVENGDNTTLYPLSLERTTTTTPANDIGVGIDFTLENSANENTVFGSISVLGTDITDASETGEFNFNLINSGSLTNEVAKLDGDGLFTCDRLEESSDERIKENIIPANIQESFEKILQLKVKDYQYKNKSDKQFHRGIIAQELRKIIPSATNINEFQGIKDFHHINSTEILFHLVAAFQYLYSTIQQ